ncbi:hypothetical protein [Streptomyces lichenis]|uniref:Uncharacterized protein n=1 Tax=Streptomyces lichenis TaxID=2306967 RepID=A0ABT0IEU6_9ACTN|nr:hypothetical protein [Streptomyces lichenis]MCK8679816.1 hypothetical protein [Streptomyces lichenis]
MRRALNVVLATALASGGAIIATASPAQAACADRGTYIAIINKKTVWKPTNVHSDWARPGVTITYAKSKEGTWKAEGTATVGAEAGVIFTKASASFSATIGKSWTKSDRWSYAATVQRKAGKSKGRLMMYHEARSFTAHKYRVYTGAGGACKLTTVYKKPGTYPVKKNSNLWGLQYS